MQTYFCGEIAENFTPSIYQNLILVCFNNVEVRILDSWENELTFFREKITADNLGVNRGLDYEDKKVRSKPWKITDISWAAVVDLCLLAESPTDKEIETQRPDIWGAIPEDAHVATYNLLKAGLSAKAKTQLSYFVQKILPFIAFKWKRWVAFHGDSAKLWYSPKTKLPCDFKGSIIEAMIETEGADSDNIRTIDSPLYTIKRKFREPWVSYNSRLENCFALPPGLQNHFFNFCLELWPSGRALPNPNWTYRATNKELSDSLSATMDTMAFPAFRNRMLVDYNRQSWLEEEEKLMPGAKKLYYAMRPVRWKVFHNNPKHPLRRYYDKRKEYWDTVYPGPANFDIMLVLLMQEHYRAGNLNRELAKANNLGSLIEKEVTKDSDPHLWKHKVEMIQVRALNRAKG